MTGEFFCFILFFWFWLFCVLKASYGIGILFPNSGKFSVMNLLKMFPVPLEWDSSPIHIMSKTGLVECHVWSAHYTFLLVFLWQIVGLSRFLHLVLQLRYIALFLNVCCLDFLKNLTYWVYFPAFTLVCLQ